MVWKLVYEMLNSRCRFSFTVLFLVGVLPKFINKDENIQHSEKIKEFSHDLMVI